MREIKELISLEDAKKLIGATVQGVSTRDSGVLRDACDRGIVRSVSIDGDGDLEFVLDNCECVFVTEGRVRDSWHLEVIQEPPTAGPVRLDENTPLEALRRYVGAVVRAGDPDEVDDYTFTVSAVYEAYGGDVHLMSTETGGWWLTGGDYVTVVQDPPQADETPDEEPSTETLTERVERLKDELKTAEDALACEGLPDGWIRDDARDNRGGARSPRIALCDSLGNLSQAIQWNNDDHTEVYAERRFGGRRHQYVGISTDALFAWVDLVRAENPDT